MNIKRISLAFNHIKTILSSSWSIAKHYSFVFAMYGLIWWYAFYLKTPISWKISLYALNKKTLWLNRYFEKNYNDIITKYTSNYPPLSNRITSPKIWIYWGQGKDAMPPLVRACYNQLKKYNDNIVLLTESNLKEYVNLDSIISNKVRSKKIGYANYSDIIRNTVIAKYGGLWLDSTEWVSGKLPIDQLMNMSLYTANNPNYRKDDQVCFWSSYDCNWSSWCLWSNQTNHPFFCFVSEMLSAIAIKEKVWPDYVIQDYLFLFAYRNIPQIKEQFANMSISNPYKDSLAFLMPEEFNQEKYNELCSNDFLFKLRYRIPWPKVTKSGAETFYGRILNEPI